MVKVIIVLLIVLWSSSTIPGPEWIVEEDIKFYKARCAELYPIASLDIEEKTNHLIITWKDGTQTKRQ